MKKKIVTLCGSSRFEKEFIDTKNKLESHGYSVLTLDLFSKNRNIFLTKEQMELLRDVHKNKIKLSDEIFVINKNNYIGEDTLKEIVFAKKLNKKINYLESFD